MILPDVRGLHPFFEELALRFAEAGVHAVAIDYFSRTAGTGRASADFDSRAARRADRSRDPRRGRRARRVDYLRSADGGAAERIYTVGLLLRRAAQLPAGRRRDRPGAA